jgi:hypothetical protein
MVYIIIKLLGMVYSDELATSGSNKFHKKCFKCSNCKSKISGPHLYKDNILTCKDCLDELKKEEEKRLEEEKKLEEEKRLEEEKKKKLEEKKVTSTEQKDSKKNCIVCGLEAKMGFVFI